MNVEDVKPEAGLQIALVDNAERPLAGYTAELTRSSLKAPVAWAGNKVLPAQTPFRIKVTWPAATNNAKLYAIYLERQ